MEVPGNERPLVREASIPARHETADDVPQDTAEPLIRPAGRIRGSTFTQIAAHIHPDCRRADQGVSGAVTRRPGLTAALERCGPGDVLVAWKLDRLGRSTLDLVGLVETLKGRGVGLKVLTGEGASVDTTRPEGKLIFAVFAAFAEFERELIRERTRAGMTAARRRGVVVGRPRKLTAHQLAHARQLIDSGTETHAGAAALLGVDPVTLRRALKAAA
jgi:DNA invertase Pin-like site-specific DNA recombinase